MPTRSPNPNEKARRRKPRKPHPDFPLTANGNGQWSKKIRGKVHYFGPWADPDAALRRYVAQRDDLLAGRRPRNAGDDAGITVRDLLNRFLTAKQDQHKQGEITKRTFDDYHRTCRRLARVLCKTTLVSQLNPDDFSRLRNDIAETHGLVALGNEIMRVRVVFNFAYEDHLIEAPMRYGANFKRPARRVLRREQQRRGPRMFESAEIAEMHSEAGTQLRAMILLGINCGFGNADVATLPMTALDLGRSWINYPRPKTGIERRCPLWADTVTALRSYLECRPKAKSDEDSVFVFITKYGKSWSKASSSNPISAECRKLVQRLDIYREGLGFYALRHTFETVAGESRDQVAVDYIMGHAREDMASVYRERISDERLMAVVRHVRQWLFVNSGADGS